MAGLRGRVAESDRITIKAGQYIFALFLKLINPWLTSIICHGPVAGKYRGKLANEAGLIGAEMTKNSRMVAASVDSRDEKGTSGVPADIRELDMHIPLSSHAVFWRPRHIVPSPMLGQVPLLFWIMETIRPRSVVQLGLGDGLVYMTLCQAAERLGASAGLLGLQPAAPLLPPTLHQQHDAQYCDFSTLIQGDLRDKRWLQSTIDLLVLASDLTTEEAEAVQERWLPRMSASGVVLVCQPDRLLVHSDLRQALLGDPGRATISGPLSAGAGMLDIVLYGSDQSERLRRLAAQDIVGTAHLAARQVFNRLGEAVTDNLAITILRQQQDESSADQDRLAKELAARNRDIATLGAELQATAAEKALRIKIEETSVARNQQIETLRRELAEARIIAEASEAKLADFAVRVDDLREELTKYETSSAASRAKVAAIQAEKAVLEGELATLRKQLAGFSALQAEYAALQQEYAARVDDIAVLMRETEAERKREQAEHARLASDLGEQLADLREELTKYEASSAASRAKVAATRAEKAVLEGELAALRKQLVGFSALQAEYAALQQEYDARVDDIAVLMRETEARRKEEGERQRQALVVVQGQLAAVQRDLAHAHAAHAHDVKVIRESTSWRITSPMRGLKTALTRHKE